jgi:YfiH family protein
MPPELLRPQWDAPPTVHALMSTRRGGQGVAPFDSFNLKLDPADPAAEGHRRQFAAAMGAQPVWLRQVHGSTVAVLDGALPAQPPEADASVTTEPGVCCVVSVADCLPVLLCTADGRGVAAAHAGWRGLAGGVLERTVQALCTRTGCEAAALRAWLGPCIGPRRFEVGADVLEAFGRDPAAPDDAGFRRRDRPDGQPRWLADLPALARRRLAALGVVNVSGSNACTVEDASRFFSFRRDRSPGRMAAAIVRLR